MLCETGCLATTATTTSATSTTNSDATHSYSSTGASPGALLLIAHRLVDVVNNPTHALILGQGEEGTGFECGEWGEMEGHVRRYFAEQDARRPPRVKRQRTAEQAGVAVPSGRLGAPLVEFRGVSVSYPTKTVFEKMWWTVREGDKWVVAGPNGSGKSTLLELVTGENLQGYNQDVWLFGRRKGSGESIWDIKRQLGVISTKFHMSYTEYADPSQRRTRASLSTWEVVCSGFYDSIGLYKPINLEQEKIARDWVHRFGLTDLVTPPALGVRRVDRRTGKITHDRPVGDRTAAQSFHQLSHGQQKLVLLCRAMVKQPRLLLLDEPTHGLTGDLRDRLLDMLSALTDDPSVTIVYISHHQDEIESLNFPHVLQLKPAAAAAPDAA